MDNNTRRKYINNGKTKKNGDKSAEHTSLWGI